MEKEKLKIKTVTPLHEEMWIIELASNEKSMLSRETINIKDETQFRENEVRKQTEDLIVNLKSRCARLVEIFNQNKGPESNLIKLFKIAGTQYDFMLFRNTLKLVFTNPKAGVIDIYFSSYLEANKPDENPHVSGERLELLFGPFDEPFWTVKNQRINTSSMLRKFLSDFIMLSCR